MSFWKSTLIVLFAFLIGCSFTPDPPRAMSPVATTYLNEVLDVMRRRSIKRHTIDWEQFRARMFAIAEGAQTTADTYRAIRFMVSQLGDNHSSFLPPVQARQLDSASSSPESPLPRGELLEERIGYLWLPYLVGDGAHATTYVITAHSVIRALDARKPCGWIVDLTENQGGNMWPMLAGIGPILGEGDVGSFVDPDGVTRPWSYDDGQALMGTQVMAHIDGTAYTLKRPAPPVAVLTSKQTASSGEAITVAFRGRSNTRSFGQPTAGASTGNATYRLSDGAVLILTEVTFVDRMGTSYGTTIMPDERPWIGTSAQGVAAVWLLQQTACAAR